MRVVDFLDAYSGYHKIKLNPADRLKTASITPFGAFCYLTMMFGLRNAGATFQRCMQKCLLKQLGRNAHSIITNITIRYGIPHNIITDNDTNFAKGALAHFCATQGIRLDLASVAHRSQTTNWSEQTASSCPASSLG